MSVLALSEGVTFNHRYRIVRCIAQGGMGAVYEVIHLETERRRALKVMLPHLVQSDDLRGRFRQEARIAAHIESEHIADVFDAGVDEVTGMPFLVMELLRGEDLRMRLRRVGRFRAEEVITYLHQTALALERTHRAQIVHRDLKPDNLFLTEREDGRPHIKVLDFGVAKLVADSATNAAATRSIGTPLYMAPEQVLPRSSVSPATDIYALGMMAYTFLVGSAYWHEESRSHENIFAFAAILVNGPPEAPTARAARRNIRLPPSFDAWFQRATAVNPADRYSSPLRAVLDLADALGVAHVGRDAEIHHETDAATAVLPAAAPPAASPSPPAPRDSSSPDIEIFPLTAGSSCTISTPTSVSSPRRSPAPRRITAIITATSAALLGVALGIGLLVLRFTSTATAAAVDASIPPEASAPPETALIPTSATTTVPAPALTSIATTFAAPTPTSVTTTIAVSSTQAPAPALPSPDARESPVVSDLPPSTNTTASSAPPQKPSPRPASTPRPTPAPATAQTPRREPPPRPSLFERD